MIKSVIFDTFSIHKALTKPHIYFDWGNFQFLLHKGISYLRNLKHLEVLDIRVKSRISLDSFNAALCYDPRPTLLELCLPDLTLKFGKFFRHMHQISNICVLGDRIKNLLRYVFLTFQHYISSFIEITQLFSTNISLC